MGIAITRAATGVGRSRATVVVRLVLLLDRNRFALFSNGTRLSPSPLVVDCGGSGSDGLRPAIEAAVSATLGIDVRYLALLDIHVQRKTTELVVAVKVLAPARLLALFPDVVPRGFDDIRGVERFAQELDCIETAYRWAVLTDSTSRLDQSVRDIFARSIGYLDRRGGIDGDYFGWNEYQNRPGIGVLSTAQGLLCHIHTACGSGIVHQAASTLEALQNDDGGWPVRMALRRGSSSKSVTESTCACLWALHEAGRTAADRVMRDGIAWLEQTRYEGGWRSSDCGDGPHVGATSAAVHVLAMLDRGTAAASGVEWLRRAQHSDNGGWALEAPKTTKASDAAHPAYTAHALVALLAAGVPTDDPAVVGGRAYLMGSFDRSLKEPWASTTYNYVVDRDTSAELHYCIFASPWALAALLLGGCDTTDSRIQLGLERLLALQEASGAWNAEVAPYSLHPIWAAHDALFALRVFVDTLDRSPAAHFLAVHRDAELRRQEQAIAALLDRESKRRPLRRFLGAIVALAVGGMSAGLLLVQLGLLDVAQSLSWLLQPLMAAALALVTIGGVVVPAVIIKEYEIRRLAATRRDVDH